MIKPTIGRQVWFWKDTPEGDHQPEAATVCYVWNDTLVNLQVIDANGVARGVTSVRLHQGDEPGVGTHCAWMPFQKGQAQRTEQLERTLTPPRRCLVNEANTMANILGRNESVDEASARLNLVAPRVTPADLEANIAGEFYLNGAEAVGGVIFNERMRQALGLLTICVLVTRNGFTVIGHSAPASPENYREELGRRYAKENAVRQLWPLMGYALRQDLHRSELAGVPFFVLPSDLHENGDGR